MQGPKPEIPKHLIWQMKRQGRRREAKRQALDSALTTRLQGQSLIRKELAKAVQKTCPPDTQQLEEIFWPFFAKYCDDVFAAIAERRLLVLGPTFRVSHYLHWLYCTCIPAIVEEVCNGAYISDIAKHLIEVIGDPRWPAPGEQTRRALARLMVEILGGPHSESLERRLKACLEGQVAAWEAKAIEARSMKSSPPSTPLDLPHKDAHPRTKAVVAAAGESPRESAKSNQHLAAIAEGTSSDPENTALAGDAPGGRDQRSADFPRPVDAAGKNKKCPPAEVLDSPAASAAATVASSGRELDCVEVRAWDEVEIVFLSEHRVQIKSGDKSETRNYAEFGFEDGRSHAPNLAWVALRAMAEGGGKIRRPREGQDWPSVEKRMQEIRKVLRNRFKLDDDPVPFVEGAGYCARFRISCAPSFHS
jgi:hypothetical protein